MSIRMECNGVGARAGHNAMHQHSSSSMISSKNTVLARAAHRCMSLGLPCRLREWHTNAVTSLRSRPLRLSAASHEPVVGCMQSNLGVLRTSIAGLSVHQSCRTSPATHLGVAKHVAVGTGQLAHGRRHRARQQLQLGALRGCKHVTRASHPQATHVPPEPRRHGPHCGGLGESEWGIMACMHRGCRACRACRGGRRGRGILKHITHTSRATGPHRTARRPSGRLVRASLRRGQRPLCSCCRPDRPAQHITYHRVCHHGLRGRARLHCVIGAAQD